MKENVQPPVNPFTSEKVVHNGPTVKYDASLNSSQVSYNVKVDGVKCADLLRELGVNDSEIDRLQIHVLRRARGTPDILGRFDMDHRTIEIFSDPIWDHYVRNRLEASKLKEGQVKNASRQFNGFVYTKRLGKYLQDNPSDRSLKFAKKLLEKAIDRIASSDFIHEAKHASDLSDAHKLKRVLEKIIHIDPMLLIGLMWASGYGGAILKNSFLFNSMLIFGGGFVVRMFGYPFDPFEIRARKTAKKYENDPRFKDMITVRPKEQDLYFRSHVEGESSKSIEIGDGRHSK